MLLSLAPLKCGDLTGVLMLLHRQWTSSAANQSEEIIGSYTEALFRLLNDRESTKPYLARLGSPALSDLESASEISMRRLPERFRKGCSVFAVVQDHRASKTRVHYKLPEWIHLSLLDQTRNAFEIRLKKETWQSFDAAEKNLRPGPWSQALINFFEVPNGPDLLQVQNEVPDGITHFRLAELIQRSQLPGLAPCYALGLL